MKMDERPREQGMLDVGGGHHIYWEEWGSPTGIPTVYLHGGPGGTLRTGRYRNQFNLECTRLVGYEQRGCGRSTPHASELTTSLTDNTTTDLTRDLEQLRRHLGIDSWIVNGVSWGSTLALAYVQAHPDRVLGLVLVAVTTTSRREVDWITEGVGAVFPEAWDRLAGHAEESGIGYRRGASRLVSAYAELMNSSEPHVRDAASLEWALWEDTHVSIGTGGLQRDPRWDDARFRHAFVRLTTHYWSHDGFCRPPVMDQMGRLAHVPGVLLHGRRDISSPSITAWELHRRWPASQLFIDEGDGHGGNTMGVRWREANIDLQNRVAEDDRDPRARLGG